MKLTKENLLGAGSFGEVYKIKTKDKKLVCAAKIFKIPISSINSFQ